MGEQLEIKRDFSFIDHISDGVIVFKENKIIDINASILDILGGKREEYLNHSLREYINISADAIRNIECESAGAKLQHAGSMINSQGIALEMEFILSKSFDSYMLIVKNINKYKACKFKCLSREKKENENEKIYKWLLGAIPDAVIIYNEDCKIVYANKAAACMTQKEDYKELIGKSVKELIEFQQEYYEILCRGIEHLLGEHNGPSSVVQKMIKKDGTILIIEVSAISYNEDNTKNVMLIVRDITEKEIIEEKLKQSEEWHKSIVEFIPNALFVTYEGICTFANRAGARLLGTESPEKLIGRKKVDCIHSEYLPVIEERERQLHVENTCTPFAEIKMIRDDGEIVDTEVISAPFIYNGKNSVISMASDIRRRKKAEEALVESEERYSRLVELCPDGVFVIDEERIVFTNQAGANILNAPSVEDIIGKKFMDFSHPDYKDVIKERVDEVYTDNVHKKSIIQSKIMACDGTVKDVEVVNIDFYDKGRKLMLNMVRDVTERGLAEENKRQLEEALEYDRMKTEFFSNLSHELKTPLNIILGALQLISSQHRMYEDCVNYNGFSRYFKIMKQNCYRLLRLINNLIDITRLDIGFLKINLSNHDIVSVVEDICLSVAEYTKSNKINLTFDTDVEEKIMAFDPDKIERVILNLLSNAIKFNKEDGGIDINIHDKDDYVEISVQDTGIGIPEDMRDKIFERFRQVDNLFTRSAEGSGIGLSLVKSLIEAHGGTIVVESSHGEGSEFIIKLPVKMVEGEAPVIKEDQFKEHHNVERINIEFSDIYA